MSPDRTGKRPPSSLDLGIAIRLALGFLVPFLIGVGLASVLHGAAWCILAGIGTGILVMGVILAGVVRDLLHHP